MSISGIPESDLVHIAFQTLKGKVDQLRRDWRKIDPNEEAREFITAMGKSSDPRIWQISDVVLVNRVQSAFVRAFDAIQLEALQEDPLRLLDHRNLSPEASKRLLATLTDLCGHGRKVERFLREYLEELDYEVNEKDIFQQSEVYRTLIDRLIKDLRRDENITRIAFRQLRNRDRQQQQIDFQSELDIFISSHAVGDDRMTRLAFKRAFEFYQIKRTLSNPRAILPLLSIENQHIAHCFPAFCQSYLHAFETMARHTLSPTDSEGHIRLFEQIVNRLNRDLPALEKGMEYLEGAMSPSDFLVFSALHRLKNDPRIREGTIPDWGFLSENYPDLVDPRLFDFDPQGKYLATVTNPGLWFSQFISCFKNLDADSARSHLRDFAFIENIIQNTDDDLSVTDFYRHLVAAHEATPRQIANLVRAAEQNLPSRIWNAAERRQHALIYLAAHRSIFDKSQNARIPLMKAVDLPLPLIDAFDREIHPGKIESEALARQKARINAAYVFLKQQEPDERGSVNDAARAFCKAHQGISVPEARAAMIQAFKAIRFEEACEILKEASPAINLPLHPKCVAFFELYPQYAQRYLLQAYQDYKLANPVGIDAEALSHAWRKLMQRLDDEIPFLSEAIDRMRNLHGIHEPSFRSAYYLHCAEHDPRIKEMTPEQIWAFLKEHYLHLTRRVNEELFLQRAVQSGQWANALLSCMPMQEQLDCRSILPAFEFLEDIVQTPADRITETRFYQYLHHKLRLSQEAIDEMLQTAEQNIAAPSPGPQERRKQAMLCLVSQDASQRREYAKIFDGSDLRMLDRVSRDFATMNPEEFATAINLKSVHPLSQEAKTFIAFGSLIGSIENAKRNNPLFNAIMNRYHPAIRGIFAKEDMPLLWQCRASLAFETVLQHALREVDSPLPTNVDGEIHKMIAKPKIETALPGRQTPATLTDQFSRDIIRYSLLMLLQGNQRGISFPGGFPTLESAQGALVNELERLAGGDKELFFLLQEMAGQTPQNMATNEWLNYHLDTLVGLPKILGFLLTIPRNSAIAIHKLSDGLFTVSYDFEMRTTNQYMMENMELAPPGYKFQNAYKFRIRYQMVRDPSGHWVVRQPEWLPLDSQSPALPQINHPVQAQPPRDVRPLALQERLALLPKAVLGFDSADGFGSLPPLNLGSVETEVEDDLDKDS